MIVKDVLQKSIGFFRSKGVEGARWEVEALLAHGLGWERIQLYVKAEYPMNEVEIQRCRELIQRRGQGVPTAYLVGHKNFYKSKFTVGSDVLIPRADSEVLVEQLLKVIPSESKDVVMDWGCGTGCLGLSLLVERPELKLLAVDAFAAPIALTRSNAEALGLADRTEVLQKDIEDLTPAEAMSFNISPTALIANPPYISPADTRVEASVMEHEPHSALFSEDQGLHHLKSWMKKALIDFPSLQHMIFEIGFDQAYAVQEFLKPLSADWSLQVFKDLGGRDRALMLSRQF